LADDKQRLANLKTQLQKANAAEERAADLRRACYKTGDFTDEAARKYKAESDARELSDLVDLPAVIARVRQEHTSLLALSKPLAERLPGIMMLSQRLTDAAAMLAAALQTTEEIAAVGRQQVEAIRTRTVVPIRPAPAPVKAVESPAPDATERRPLYLFVHAKWREPNGEIKTAPAYAVVQVPSHIAALAIKNNLGDDPGSLRSVNVRSVHGTDSGPARPPNECQDLSEPPLPERRYLNEHRDVNLHSKSDAFEHDQKAAGYVKKGRDEVVGTATSVPRY
jgi:hypothetical protein